MPEDSPAENNAHQVPAASDRPGEGGGLPENTGGAPGGEGGDQGLRADQGSAANPQPADMGTSGGAASESGISEPGNAEAGNRETAADDRPKTPRRPGRPSKWEVSDIARALREADGDRRLAAAALGIDTSTLNQRVHCNPQLKALWGQTDGVDGPAVPRETQAMNRNIDVLPEVSPEGVELAQMVSENDNEILRKGLAKLGVSDTMIKRLKTLDGLAKSGGHFLSISLEKVHRLYFLQVVHLHEVADLMRQRLLAKPGEDGHITSDETRAYFTRNYVELVKEGGSAYKLMMEGASNMVRMLQAAKGGDDETPGATGKPKWGRVKNVSKDANAKD